MADGFAGRLVAGVPAGIRQWCGLGLPRLFDALSRLPRGADRGGDGQLSGCRRHLHGHLVPAAVHLVVGQDQDGGARARLDGRARPRHFHRAVGRKLLHPHPRCRAKAQSENAAVLQLGPYATRPAQALFRLLHPPRAREPADRRLGLRAFPAERPLRRCAGHSVPRHDGQVPHPLGRGRRLQEARGAGVRGRRHACARRALLDRRSSAPDRPHRSVDHGCHRAGLQMGRRTRGLGDRHHQSR